jgi:hypothetical protein
MSNKVVAILGIVIGGLASILQLLNAFGMDISMEQQEAIASVAGLMLLAVSAWLHPSIPVGNQDA